MDEQIKQRFLAGDKAAFKIIYEAYAESSLRVCRVILKDDSLAADAVQEAFLRAYLYRGRYDPEKAFKAWLKRIVVNEALRILARQKQRPEVLAFEAETHAAGHADTYGFEKYEVLYNALENLPDYQRIPLVLKYVDGFKEAEIAEILGLKPSTVKSRLYDGRQQMKQKLSQSGYGDDSDE